MRGWHAATVIALLIVGGVGIVQFYDNRLVAPSFSMSPLPLRVTSTAFSEGGSIPAQHTCDGANTNPPLTIEGVPDNATSLVLIMDDPDAPRGTWDHWVLFNVPPNMQVIEEGKEPPGAHGRGSGAALMYSGPCPPDREHRYFFKLYALDAMLDLPEGASKQEIEHAMNGHVLAHTQLMGRYDRAR